MTTTIRRLLASITRRCRRRRRRCRCRRWCILDRVRDLRHDVARMWRLEPVMLQHDVDARSHMLRLDQYVDQVKRVRTQSIIDAGRRLLTNVGLQPLAAVDDAEPDYDDR